MNPDSDQQLDCVVRVVTPENIEFDYMLAGPFQRLPAFLTDVAIRGFAFFIFAVIMGLAGVFIGGLGYLLSAFLLVLLFFLSWLYGAVMETYFNGRTVGKMLFRLRVISADGRPISGSQAAIRNLLRIADLFPPLSLQMFSPDLSELPIVPTFFFGLIAATLTTRMQRLGDLAAGTIVISDRVRGVSANLQPEDARAYALAEHIPPTFQITRSLARVVGLYMERRKLLHPLRRSELAAYVAQPLIKEFGLLPDTSTDLLMCALYVRIYHSQSQREQNIMRNRNPASLQTGVPYTTVAAPYPSYDVQVIPTSPNVGAPRVDLESVELVMPTAVDPASLPSGDRGSVVAVPVPRTSEQEAR